MTQDDWEALKDLFEQALAYESAEEQRAFVASNCSDAALRAELESLLGEHRRMGAAFLEQTPVRDVRAEAGSPALGTFIGAYRLERELGRGGMGTVFLASRADGAYEKQVAIKLLSVGAASEELVRRFLAERQILARLDHPNIARLVDGGTTEHGRPYLVMDYVDGIPIDRYCRERSLNVDQRLELFARVCSAVAYAQENMVVHRDIKPGNILVTADGTPKLLDFGIAKLLHPDTGDAESRRTLLVFGTPEYSSPEQVSGQGITKATDVYSLGVLLYELLTDRSPYQVVSRAAHEMARVICEDDPEPPSRATGRRTSRQDGVSDSEPHSEDDHKRRKRLSGELDNIVMLALRKAPQERYQTVADLAEDLRRHAQGLPVHARGRTWRYRALKFARRHRPALAAAASISLALVATTEAVRQGRIPRSTEVTNRRIWERVADSVSPDGRLLSFSDWRHAADLSLHDLQSEKERRLTKNRDERVASSALSRDGRWLAYTCTFQTSGDEPLPMELRIIDADGAGQRMVFRDADWTWLIVHGWTDNEHVLISSEQSGPTKLLLVSIADGSLRVLPVPPGFRGSRVMISPDGRHLAYTAEQEGSRNTEVRVISLATGADAALLTQPADDSILGWAPDGSKLVFSSNRSGVGGYDIWSVPMANGQALGVPERFGPTPDLFKSLGISSQGALYYAASNDSDEIFLADLDSVSGKFSAPRVLSGRFAGAKIAPTWSPDGNAVFYVAGDMFHLHSLTDGSERDVQPRLRELKRVVAWHPNRRSVFEYVTAADGQQGLSLVDTETGAAEPILEGRMDDAALSLDGKTLYIQGGPQRKNIVARNLSTGEEKSLYTAQRRSDIINARLSLSPDGEMLAMQLWNVPAGFNSLAVLPVAGGEPRVLLQIREPRMFGTGSIAWSPDGRYIYGAWSSGLFQHGLGYDDHSEFWRVRPDGSAPENTGLSVEGTIRNLHLNSNGRQVVFQTSRSTGETWVLENFLNPPKTR